MAVAARTMGDAKRALLRALATWHERADRVLYAGMIVALCAQADSMEPRR
jgi:hypothetical protein